MGEFGKELEDYFCRFTFGQFVTLILLELVTLFFVFYLGARYGPDLIGGRKELTKAPETTEEIVGKPPVDYTFPEVLSGSGAIRVKPSGMTAEEYEEQKRVVIPVPEPVEVAPEVIKQASPSPPVISSTATSGGSFAIQVGSYPSAQEAARMVDKWKQKGYQTVMTVGEIPHKGTWYRVRIGQFKSRDEARVFLEKFKSREKSDGLVVSTKS